MTSLVHAAIGDAWSREIILDALKEASEVSGRTVGDLIGPGIDKLTAQARQAAMWEAHRKGVGYSTMARFFQKDHTTVMHAVKVAERRATENAAFVSVPFFKSTRSAK